MTGAMNVPIMLGATMILLPRFEIDDVLTSIKRYKPTVFPGVPAMYTAINYAPNARSYGLSSIQVCISGAAPLPLEVQEEFEKITRGRLVEGYGLTEASPITHAHPLHTSHKPGSIGVPLPNTDARIVDPDSGEALEPHQIGELAVRGPQVMMGYCESDASGANTRLENDWLYTGDLAAMDEDGYFTIIGRKADVIMLGDQVVYPRDVEEILYEHSKIKEAAVVGTGSAATGQEVTAFVVAEPGAELSERKLRDFCIRRLEAYEVPTTFVFLDALPKTITGKVQRRFLQTDDIT
jgi:long-chain acyl-CoA synthetase